jgi:hypothetical protein
MSGFFLRLMLGLSGKFCEIIGALCFRLLALFANEILGRRVQDLENRLVEQSRLLKHLYDEIEIACKAEADLRIALIEIDDRAHAATQSCKEEKAQLQAALDRANGERARLAYDLANMKRHTRRQPMSA